MLRRSWMKGNSSFTQQTQSDYEERNRISSFRGYLYKLRRSQNMLAPQWGKRWFTIEGHFFKWYRHEQDLCSSGMVDLKYIRNIQKLENNTTYGQYSFIVECEERQLTVRCMTLSEMNHWIRALHRQADIARGGSGTNLINQSSSAQQQQPQTTTTTTNTRPKSSAKPRNSMTFEEELDSHLKKLEELQHDVVDPVMVLDNTRTNNKKKKRFDDGEDHHEFEEKYSEMKGGNEEENKSGKHDRKRMNRAEAKDSFDDDLSCSSTAPSPVDKPITKVRNGMKTTTRESYKQEMKRVSSQDSMEDSYEFDDAMPVRTPGKRSGTTTTTTSSSTSAASKEIERVESIEDIELMSTKVSRSKQRLKENQRNAQLETDFNKENSLRSSRTFGTKSAWN